MSPQPPRRPGTGKPVAPPPERSISPAPEGQRVPVLPSLEPPKPTIPVGRDDSAAVRLLELSEARERRLAADLAREKARVDELERKSNVPELPSPKHDRETTLRDWPPGVQPSQEIHVHVERGGPESQAPKSARQRAGEAIKGARQPLIVTLISTLLSGGGVTAVLASRESAQPAPDATAAAGYALLKSEVERQAAEQRRQAEQQAQFQGWILGFLRATGTRVDAPPGTQTTVEIRATPAPAASVAPVLAARRRGGAPEPARVEVLTPPPPSLPPPKAPDLPERLGP